METNWFDLGMYLIEFMTFAVFTLAVWREGYNWGYSAANKKGGSLNAGGNEPLKEKERLTNGKNAIK